MRTAPDRKTISVKPETWQRLTKIKAEMIAESLDDVLTALMDSYGSKRRA